jgi:uncharacterized small protein (DUF1192 family)
MSDILSRSITDPHGDKLLEEMAKQDLSNLSRDELARRIESLKQEISRIEAEQEKRGSVTADAEALFKQ